jgi:hypothetical protein
MCSAFVQQMWNPSVSAEQAKLTEIPNRHPSPDRSQMRSTNRQAETAWKLRGSRTLLAPHPRRSAFSEACHFFLLPSVVPFSTPCNAGS